MEKDSNQAIPGQRLPQREKLLVIALGSHQHRGALETKLRQRYNRENGAQLL